VRTGALGGEITVEVTDPYELVPLGDGSWLTSGPDGAPVRRPHAPAPNLAGAQLHRVGNDVLVVVQSA
jgi:hypothetical protein